jgi:hypothetical protein
METVRIKSPWDKKGRWMQITDREGATAFCPYTRKLVLLYYVTDGVARIPTGLKIIAQ